MNIVFFHNSEIISEKGGIARITSNLCKIFKNHNHNIYYIARQKVYEDYHNNTQFILPDANKLDSDENIHYFICICKKYNIDIIINQNAMQISFVNFIHKIKENLPYLKTISCIHNSILLPVKYYAFTQEYKLRKHKLDLIFYILKNNFIKYLYTKYFIKTRRNMYRTIIKKSDAVVLLLDELKKELEIVSGYKHISNVHIIPNCNNIDFEKSTKEIDFSKKQNSILWVGRTDFSIKRIDYMLKIWDKVHEKYPNWHLNIIGHSNNFNEVKELTGKLNLKNITFHGNTQPFEFYKDATIICITSIHESFSLVTLEALSQNVIPIAFNSFPAASKMIKHKKNGILINPFDLNEYTNELLSLIRDKKLRQDLSNSKINTIDKYKSKIVYLKWNKLFKSLMYK